MTRRRPRLYVDLDNTLICGDVGDNQVVVYKRPGATRFLRWLASFGDVFLLTHGTREHAKKSLEVTGFGSFFKGVIAREDLSRVTPGKGPKIASRGYMFDDFPVGSWLYDLKATAIGIGPEHWIQVDYFGPGAPDEGGLAKAAKELARRVGA